VAVSCTGLSQPVHGTATYTCDDTRGRVMQFWPPDDEHMCSKHVEVWNKLTVKKKICVSSWLITEINILRCSTVSKTSKCRRLLIIIDVFYCICTFCWSIKDIIYYLQKLKKKNRKYATCIVACLYLTRLQIFVQINCVFLALYNHVLFQCKYYNCCVFFLADNNKPGDISILDFR